MNTTGPSVRIIHWMAVLIREITAGVMTFSTAISARNLKRTARKELRCTGIIEERRNADLGWFVSF